MSAETFNEDLKLRAIPAMLRTAEAVLANVKTVRNALGMAGVAENPYINNLSHAATSDAETLRAFAQSICPHPDESYYTSQSNEGTAHCTLCNRYWPYGEDREDNAERGTVAIPRERVDKLLDFACTRAVRAVEEALTSVKGIRDSFHWGDEA